MNNLTPWQAREMRELIYRLVAMEQPATTNEAKRLRREWRDVGYEAAVSAWAYCHRKTRHAEPCGHRQYQGKLPEQES